MAEMMRSRMRRHDRRCHIPKMELATTPEKVNYENGQQMPLDTVKVAAPNIHSRIALKGDNYW
jgi:hypothetical protein